MLVVPIVNRPMPCAPLGVLELAEGVSGGDAGVAERNVGAASALANPSSRSLDGVWARPMPSADRLPLSLV